MDGPFNTDINLLKLHVTTLVTPHLQPSYKGFFVTTAGKFVLESPIEILSSFFIAMKRIQPKLEWIEMVVFQLAIHHLANTQATQPPVLGFRLVC